MWDRLRRELDVELGEIAELLRTAAQAVPAPESSEPSRVESIAVAAILHSFYNGAENLLKRIEVATHGTLPSGEHWHAELLDLAQRETAYRPPALSNALARRLVEYRRFRHAFRHLYAHQLDWEDMADLVHDLPETARWLEEEIRGFLCRLEAWPPPPA